MLKDTYINLFTDFGFKRIFGTEANQDLLIHFLNTVLDRKQNPIVNITYLKNELLGKKAKDRKAIFDLYCESADNERFIIELQRAEQDFFKDRCVYYTSFPLQEQGKKGKNWNYELMPIYTIGIMDFVFDKQYPDEIVSTVKLMNTVTKETFYDKLTFVFIEMPKFLKEEKDLQTDLDKWLYVFKNMQSLNKMPQAVQERIYTKLFEQCKIANYSQKEYMNYEQSLKDYRDWQAVMAFAEKKGEEKGAEKGEIETQQSIALELITSTTISDEQIAQIVKLTLEEVKALRNS